jgi:hypothetical protein
MSIGNHNFDNVSPLPDGKRRTVQLRNIKGGGHAPQMHPSLESQVQDACIYGAIVHTRVSEILDTLEPQFPNHFPTRDFRWIVDHSEEAVSQV